MSFNDKTNSEILKKIASILETDEITAMKKIKDIYNAVVPEFTKTVEKTYQDVRKQDNNFKNYSFDEFLIFITKFLLEQHVEFSKMTDACKKLFSNTADRFENTFDNFNDNIDEFIARAFDEASDITKQKKKDDKNSKNKKDDDGTSSSSSSKKILN